MRAADLVHRTFELFRSHPRFESGLSATMPELVPTGEFERFAARLDSAKQGSVVELIRVIRQFLPQLAVRQTFDTSNARTFTAPPPDPRTYYAKVIRYCIDTDWGRARRPESF
jgi:hypothetical protein